MRAFSCIATLGIAAVLGVAVALLPSGRAHADGYEVSYAAGGRDAAGTFTGGTEMRVLAAHDGKLYAGNGYRTPR